MNVHQILDLLFLKNHKDLFKYLNLYFSKETFVTQISASGHTRIMLVLYCETNNLCYFKYGLKQVSHIPLTVAKHNPSNHCTCSITCDCGRRPSSRKRSFRGRPETEISATKVSFEKYIFKCLNQNSRSSI